MSTASTEIETLPSSSYRKKSVFGNQPSIESNDSNTDSQQVYENCAEVIKRIEPFKIISTQNYFEVYQNTVDLFLEKCNLNRGNYSDKYSHVGSNFTGSLKKKPRPSPKPRRHASSNDSPINTSTISNGDKTTEFINVPDDVKVAYTDIYADKDYTPTNTDKIYVTMNADMDAEEDYMAMNIDICTDTNYTTMNTDIDPDNHYMTMKTNMYTDKHHTMSMVDTDMNTDKHLMTMNTDIDVDKHYTPMNLNENSKRRKSASDVWPHYDMDNQIYEPINGQKIPVKKISRSFKSNNSSHLRGDDGCIYGSLDQLYIYALNPNALRENVHPFIKTKEDAGPVFCHCPKNTSKIEKASDRDVFYSCEDINIYTNINPIIENNKSTDVDSNIKDENYPGYVFERFDKKASSDNADKDIKKDTNTSITNSSFKKTGCVFRKKLKHLGQLFLDW